MVRAKVVCELHGPIPVVAVSRPNGEGFTAISFLCPECPNTYRRGDSMASQTMTITVDNTD